MPSGSISSTQKRPWEESRNGYPAKLSRENGYRDWKDVYLNGDSPGFGRRDVERDRERYRSREERDRERDKDYVPESPDPRRDARRSYDRESYKDYGSRAGRERDRASRRHSRDERRSRRPSRSRSPRRNTSRCGKPTRRVSRDQSPHARDDKNVTNGHESEREEGEISPPGRSGASLAPPTTANLSNRRPTPPPPQLAKKPESGPEMELDLETEQPSKPVEETIAERRARRQAIRAKYAGIDSIAMSAGERASQSPGPSSAVLQPPPISSEADLALKNHSSDVASRSIETPDRDIVDASGKASPQAMSPTIESFALAKEDESQEVTIRPPDGVDEQVLAADYDPSLDRREDEEKRVRAVTGKDEKHQDVEMLEVEEEEEEDEDDVDDMFSLDALEKKTKKMVKKVMKPAAPALITTTLDSAADAEGYYNVILGEQLDSGKYQVFSSLGKGMFANVVRARVLTGDATEIGKEVAIKITRSQESMVKAGQKEAQILVKLRQADPDDKKHIVRLERTFEHRGHLCLVFESLSMNLRDVIKRFGKDVGLNIRAVRAYGYQLFLAMSLLRKCNIMHADIKPDNILANEQKTVLKVCDLGSASDVSENEITPYLVSRFYRAPEIILGLPYDCSLDIWSIGCTLYELYTGKILFPGRSNNQMLLLMMEVKGRFNSKMIKKARFGDTYFDEMGAFQSVERDKVTGADVIRKVHTTKPTRDLRSRLMPSSSKFSDEEAKLLLSFIDLLEKCLMLDPSRRITPKEALIHPFIRG